MVEVFQSLPSPDELIELSGGGVEDSGIPTDPDALAQHASQGAKAQVQAVNTEYVGLKANYNVGWDTISESKKAGHISLQDMPIEVKRQMFNEMDADVSEAERYRAQLEGLNTVPDWAQRTWFDAVAMAPIAQEVGGRSLAYGTAAAATLGTYATVASGGNPLIGAIGVGAGYGIGMPLGAFHAGFDLAYGPMYKTLIQKTQLDDTQAKWIAAAGGAVSAQLENMSFGILKGMGQKAAATVMRSPEMVKWTAKALSGKAAELGLDIGVGAVKESVIEASQTAAEQVTLIVAAMVEGMNPQTYVKFAGGDDSVIGAVTKSFLDALGPSAVLGGAASGAGTVSATAVKGVTEGAQVVNNASYQGRPITDILNDVLLSVQGKRAENPDAVKAPTLQENPDGSFSLAEAPADFTFDEAGNIVLDEGRVLTGGVTENVAQTEAPPEGIAQGLGQIFRALQDPEFVMPSEEEIAQAGLDALFPQDQQDAPQQAPDKRSLAKVMSGESDNYAMNLSNYTDTLYSETSVDGLGNFLANGETGPMGQSQMFFSNDPSLALGQGANQGVLVEMQAEGVVGQVNRGKPGLAPLAEQGIAEFKGRVENDPAQYVKSITFDLDKVDVQSKGWAANVYRSFLRAEEYTHETIGNKTKFTKAPQKQAPALQGSVTKEQAPAPEMYHATLDMSALEEGVLKKAGSEGITGITPDSDPRAVYFSSDPEWGGRSLSSARLVFDKDTLGLPEGPRYEQEQEYISSEDITISKENGLKKIILYPSPLTVEDVMVAGLEQNDPRFDGTVETSKIIAADIVQEAESSDLERVQKAAVKYADKYGVPVEIASRTSGKDVVQEVVHPPKTPQQAPAGEPLFNSIEDVVVRPLSPVEQEARLNVLAQATKAIGVQVTKQEQALDAQMVVNQQAQTLKEDLKALQQEQKGNAVQIRQLEADMKAQQKEGKNTTNIGKTLAKIKARQDAVQGQINDAKLGLGELNFKPVKAMESRLEKLYAVQDAAQFEADLIEAGLADPEEVRQQQGQLKINKISALLDATAKQVAKLRALRDRKNAQIKSARAKGKAVGERKGAREALRETRRLQKQMEVLIKESGLSDTAQKKLLLKLPKGVTEDKVIEVFPQLHQQIMALQKEEVKAGLKARIAKMLDAKKTKPGEVAKGRTTADTAATLKLYEQLIDDPKAREAVIADYLDRVLPAALAVTDTSQMGEDELTAWENRPQLSESELEAAQIAMRLANFETFDEVRLAQVAQEIADIIAEGRVEARKRQEERAARTRDLLDMAHRETPAAPTGVKWGVDKLKEMTGGWYSALNSGWTTALNIISTQGELQKVFDEIPARMEMDTGLATAIQNVADITQATLQQEGVDSTINQYAAEGAGAVTKAPIDVPGVGKFYKNNLMHMYANFYAAVTEPDVRASLEAAGMTFRDTHGDQSSEAIIERQLSNADKKVVENTIQYLTEVGYNRFNEVFREENGIDLPKVQRYYPKKVKPAKTKATELNNQQPLNRSSIMPSAAKTRGTHKRPLRLDIDFFSTLSQHLTNVEHYRAYAGWVRETNAVFTDTEVRENIKSAHGAATLAALDDFRTRITRNSRYAPTLNVPGIDWYRGLKVIDAMGGKAIMFAKVASSGNLVTMNLNPAEWATGAAALAKNWKTTWPLLFSNATLSKRSNGSANDDLRVAASSTAWTQFEKTQDLTSIWMLPLPLGDSYTVAVHGGILYHAELAKGRTAEEALTEVVRMVESTQGSSSIAETTPILASSNVARLVGMFTNQQNQIRQVLEVAMRDYGRAMADPQADHRAAFVTYMGKVANVALATEMFSLVGSAVRNFARPEDEPWEEFAKREVALHAIGLLSSLTGGAFLIGQATEMAISIAILKATGQKTFPAPRFSIWDTEMKLFRTAEDLAKYLFPSPRPERKRRGETPLEEKVLMGVLDTAGLFLRTPLDTLLQDVTMPPKLMEQGDPVGAAFAFTGASKRDLEQRQPPKRRRRQPESAVDMVLQQANDFLAGVKNENASLEEDEFADKSSVIPGMEVDTPLEPAPAPDDNIPENDIVDINLTPDFVAPEAPAL